MRPGLKRLLRGLVCSLWPALVASASVAEEAALLAKSSAGVELRMPLVVAQGPEDKPAVAAVKLVWNPEGAGRSRIETLQFRFLGPAAGLAAGVGPQLWSSALAAAIAWQETWRAVMFDIVEMPPAAGPETATALALGLMAAASGTPYPADLAVIAGLNPDNSLAPVANLPGCLEAAARAGLRRALIAVNQRIIETEDGRLVNTATLAAGLKLECLVAQDLTEATALALARRLPPEPRLDTEPRYRPAIFDILAARCEEEFNRLSEQRKAWPSEADAPPAEKSQWSRLHRDFDLGADAFRAGRVYAARLLLAQAAGTAAALAKWKERTENADLRQWDRNVNAIRERIIQLMYRPGYDKGELRSALVLAEQADWLYSLDARLEGAQVLARQAFAPRSDASREQRDLARDRLFAAWQGGAHMIAAPPDYASLLAALGAEGGLPVFDRAELWLPQLIPAHLARAESLAAGLRQYANRFGGMLVFDPRFAAFSLMVRRTKDEWEDLRVKLEDVQGPRAQAGLRKVGFRPGPAYQPPRPAVPKPPVDELSGVARCLMWVNGYCETAVLEQKYIQLGGEFDPAAQRWTLRKEAILQSLLQSADTAARRGIALAGNMGMETDMLALIFEHGSFLRFSKDDGLRLEGLRQLWRCGLLGSMAWQLGSTPRATVTVAQTPAPEPAPPVALPAIPVEGAPTPPETPAAAPQPAPSAPPKAEPVGIGPPAPAAASPAPTPVPAPAPEPASTAPVPRALRAVPVAAPVTPTDGQPQLTNAAPAGAAQPETPPPARRPRRGLFFRR